jgi:hypothetical protein
MWLLGFVPKASLPRHLCTSRAECVMADPDAVGASAHKALQALMYAHPASSHLISSHPIPHHTTPFSPHLIISSHLLPSHLPSYRYALEEEELVAVARYAPRKSAAPTLVALFPAIRTFWMVNTAWRRLLPSPLISRPISSPLIASHLSSHLSPHPISSQVGLPFQDELKAFDWGRPPNVPRLDLT